MNITKIKKILGVTAAAVMALSFAACSDEEEIDFSYEIPVDTMFEALDNEDSRSYLRCFASPVVESYKDSVNFDENLAQSLCDEITESCDAEAVVINHRIIEKKELSKDEISELTEVKERHDVKKAYLLTVRIIAASVKDHSDTYSQDIELVVGKLGDNWYICQSPVLELNLMKDIKS